MGLTLAAILGANKSEKPKIIKAADELPVGSWMLAVSLLLSAFAAYGTRVSALFSFYAIIFIPQIIDLMAASRIRRNNLIIIISALSLIQYIVRMSINNIGSTMPYYFFWQ